MTQDEPATWTEFVEEIMRVTKTYQDRGERPDIILRRGPRSYAWNGERFLLVRDTERGLEIVHW